MVAIPDGSAVTNQFYAVHGQILDPLIAYLEAVLTRPAGHPDGGPMHVDGALTMFRERHPGPLTLVARSNLGWQRSSSSDISTRRFDQIPVLRDLLRRLPSGQTAPRPPLRLTVGSARVESSFKPPGGPRMASVGLKIGPADHGRRMTLEELREADAEEGYRYELARGVLEVVEVPERCRTESGCLPTSRDSSTGTNGCTRGRPGASAGAASSASGSPRWSPRGTRTSPSSCRGRRRTRGRRPPSCVAEVVSEGGEERDYRTKREEYWAYGTREYWIVDLELRQVLVLTRGEAGWIERTCRDGEVIASTLLTGFAGTVADLWAGLDDEG